MFSRRTLGAVGFAALLGSTACVAGASQPGPRFGTVATQREIDGWNIDVLPDGRGLPPGSGTAATGATIFAAKCAACHGATALGNPVPGRARYPRLVGGFGTLTSKKPVKTVGSFWPYATIAFDYIRRAMPFYAPGSLSNDEVYALTAFILAKNHAIPAGEVMDARSLPRVKMANAHGFFPSQESIEATRATK